MSFDRRLPRYQRLRDDLAAKISARQWRAGEQIPTESKLAKDHRMAVGTVRNAIDVLVAEGMLERFQGRGTFVRRASFDGSLFRFFRFQSSTGERKIPSSKILQRRVVPAPPVVASALRVDSRSKVIRISRIRLIDDDPMLAEEIWLPFEQFQALMSLDLDHIGNLLYPEYERHCDQVIASASETLRVGSANALYARRLRVEIGTPLVIIERLAFSYDRHPLEWRRSHGPANHFLYHVEIR